MLAAAMCGRHSIGIEVEPAYSDIAARRLESEGSSLLHSNEFNFKVASAER
jgi:DNA modification methylase